MRGARVLVASAVVISLVATSCGGGSSSTTGSEPSSIASDPADPMTDDEADAAAVVEETLTSFDPDDIDAALATARDLDRQADLALAELEGITAELGGPEATEAAFAEADAAFAALTGALTTPATFGIRRPQQAEPDIGGGLFGGFMTVTSLSTVATTLTACSMFFIGFPSLAMGSCLLALNVLGDGLRDALDPRLRGAS